MSLAEKLVEICNSLTEDKKTEIIDFAEFLKQKQEKEDEEIFKKVISENAEALEELAK
jgi:hypothetical protein